jgi:hypothetical protein
MLIYIRFICNGLCVDVNPTLDTNGEQTYTKLCRQSSQTRRRDPLRQVCKQPGGIDAYMPVLPECVPSAFHFDILVGCKLRADPKRC